MPDLIELMGFWSYKHEDNQAEGGRVIELANDIVEQYSLISGDTIKLIIDKDHLEWGDKWRKKIDESLETVAFFIPVLTPRYFKSIECRRELRYIIDKSKQTGLEGIVLPILYVEVDELKEEEPKDDLVKVLKEFQWENWTELRFCDRDSGNYRKNVARLANKLIKANLLISGTGDKTPPKVMQSQQDKISLGNIETKEEPLGNVDIMVRFEETLPVWSESVNQFSDSLLEINQITTRHTDELNRIGSEDKVYAIRQAIARKMSSEMEEPVKGINKNANLFISQLYDINQGVDIIFDLISSKEDIPVEDIEGIKSIFESLETIYTSYNDALGSFSKLIESINPLENYSRDLRPVLKRFKQGITIMFEAKDVLDNWMKFIEEFRAKRGI